MVWATGFARVSNHDVEINLGADRSHTRILKLVEQGKRVLEVGCATEYVSRILTEQLGCVVTGIEIDEAAAVAARQSCQRVIQGDVETLDYCREFGSESFDVIIFAGILLERLKNPREVLQKVQPLLAPNGYILALIPNVAHAELASELETARTLVDALEQERAAILAHARRLETGPGWAKLGVRLFLGTHSYEALRSLYHGSRGMGTAVTNTLGRLARYPAFIGHLVSRIPAVFREGRFPRRPGDVLPRLRASSQSHAREARLQPLGARRPGIRRVLFLSHNLNVEGAPLSLLSLACRLDKRRYEPWVLAMEAGPLRERYEAEGVPVEVINPLRDVHTGQLYRERVDQVAEWVGRSGFELIFCNTLMCFWGVTVARAVGLPSVWCIRESVDWRTYFDYLAPDVAKAALDCFGSADRLVFVADATRQRYPTPLAPSKVHTIHNGVDVAAIEAFKRERSREAIRSANGIGDRDRVISVIGTTCERKGQMDFLGVAAALRSRYEGLHFYVVGAREDAYLTRMKSFVRDHGLSSVVFIAETPEVYDYYRMSDLFVCSSYEESFPRVILEAMAFDLPIVSTNVFGIPEAIRDGWDGILVAPGDVAGLASGVARLLDNPDLAKQLAANAYATLIQRFSVERMVQQYDRLFSEIL